MLLKEIVSAVPALGKLAAANLRLKTAYELKKTADILQKEVDFFEQERRKIAEKYGTAQEDGAVLIPAEQRRRLTKNTPGSFPWKYSRNFPACKSPSRRMPSCR